MSIDLKVYGEFVKGVTSDQSMDLDLFIQGLIELKKAGCPLPHLDMAINGLSSETGEAMEILKKIKFQGKPWNEDVKFHLIREAGDIIFYWLSLCLALNVDPNSIIEENIKKLESRYPGGKFDVHRSENRKEGDL